MNETGYISNKGMTSVEEPPELRRVTQLWRYITVTACVWVCFSIYYATVGGLGAVVICSCEAGALFILLACRPVLKNSLVVVCHVFLLLCMIGIVTLALLQGIAQRESIYFLPLGIFLASQTVGARGALIWTALICIALGLKFSIEQSFDSVDNTASLVNSLVFAGCVFFICQQSEVLFNQRALRLKQLTNDLKRQNRRVHYLAKTDSLTGLSNRYGLSEYCAEQVKPEANQGSQLAMLLIDFDKFKEINDAVGHQVGDDLLREIGRRLEKEISGDAFIGRLGGDEFCILIPNVSGEKEALKAAKEIHTMLVEPYDVRGQELSLGASIGVALYPGHSSNSVELLTYADTAMYQAKFSGRDCLIYHSAMTDELRESHELRDKLSGSLERNEFRLVYQPQVSFETGKAFGCEALIRWNHDGEEILPYKFIPVLESSGMIVEVGQWVVEEACRQLGIWQKKGYRYAVSLNVSVKQFGYENFITEVRKSIERHGVDPELLDFEITESLLIEDVEEAIERLNALKAIGCSISIDDFGTGYSSLAYLKRFPLDRLKIDREFVKDYPEGDDGLVASSVVALAQALELRVLAEGVETPEQHQFLRDCGCEEYQGYICSKPVSPEECEATFLEYDTDERIRSLTSAKA